MEKKWTVKGKYIIITGATSGIGLAAAKELVKRGANLGIIARNQAKANEVAAQLKNISGDKTVVDVFLADMSSQESIRQVAKEILYKCPKIDILINNAGAMFDRRRESVDGMEMTWAVNHLGPFLLTNLLLERIMESKQARIITTASHGHKMVKKGINFADIQAESLYAFPKSLFGGPTIRYAESKLANILFTTELAKKLEGTGVTAHCFDPGLVATNFNQNNGLTARLTMAGMKPFSRTPEKGAETLVWLAETDEIMNHNGGYYADMEKILPSKPAQNIEAAKRLWEVSEKQVQHKDSLVG